ncbi:hypothetical protein IQ22_00009 [Pseudomonas duriflava]|uniref:Uncharacterized protein n=1 Tax=Pseudomonas duriflava TaxID=459528 RepID=A0A562QNN4_9PSED|nr:hypothetical protein IQ22_00009 [Pseudomonas duriflava]
MATEHSKRTTSESPEEASKVGEANKTLNQQGEQRRTKFNEPEDPQAQRSK